MDTVDIAIPNALALQIQSTPRYGHTVGDKLRMVLAIGLFASREVSLAKAAELAGQSLVEFMATLKCLGIPAIVYSDEMLVDDIVFADRAV